MSSGEPTMNPLSAKTAQRALADSALALLAACAAVAMFLPPLAAATSASVPRSVAAGLTLALAMPLHWLFLGVAARRFGRSVAAWVGMAVLLFPVGGAAALILLAGLPHHVEPQPAAAR
jgi:hypothetical protein